MQLKKIFLVFAVACVAVFGHVTDGFSAAGDDSVYEWGPWGRQVTPAAGPPVVPPSFEPATLGYRPGDNENVTPTPIPPTPPTPDIPGFSVKPPKTPPLSPPTPGSPGPGDRPSF